MSQFIRIEFLNPSHHRSSFNCGHSSLDSYLKTQASQDVKRKMSKVFIATDKADFKKVLGFYTLSTTSIGLSQLPKDKSGKLPRHPIPAALIGRLAVNQSAQGKGMGSMLLADAVKRTLSISNEIGIYALVVDAIDGAAADFYTQYGFESLNTSNRLFLPLKSIL